MSDHEEHLFPETVYVGLPGSPGDPGIPGPRGVPGHDAPARDPWARRLGIITGLLCAGIVLIALIVTLRTQSDRSRIHTDLDHATAQLAEIQSSREAQILINTCRNAYYDDIVIGNTLLAVEQWHLFRQLGENSANTELTPEERAANGQKLIEAITIGDENAIKVEDAVSAYQAYNLIDPPPEVCPHVP